MTELMQALLEDPEATFELEADLPSGNKMMGTVGPIINGRVSAQLTFADQPPSEEDVKWAKHVINEAMGVVPSVMLMSKGAEEHAAVSAKMRQFFGGGQG